jgi:predicted porin
MMRKAIFTAFACLASTGAMAQSNVSIYGVMDLNATWAEAGSARFQGIESGGLSTSRIGFRGTESLGNGLKVVFALEYALQPDTSAAFQGARQSYLGLEGDFGFVGLGRQFTPGHNLSNRIDPFAGAPALSPVLLAQDVNYQGGTFPVATGATIQGGELGRVSRSILYRTPEWGGLSFEAMVARGNSADLSNAFGNRRAGDFIGLSSTWHRGPLTLGAAYHQTDGTRFDFGGFNYLQRDKREWYLGGRYDFGPASLAASWQEVRSGVRLGGVGSDNWRDRIWQISGLVPISESGTLLAGFAHFDGEYRAEDVKIWTLAYTYSMSRRTTAYAGYRYVDNNDAAFTGAMPGLRLDDSISGRSSQGLVLGVRHSF